MSKKKVLIVTQEMHPYTESSEIAEISRQLPQYIQENGMEIRVLMPRFGAINERRHRLHEVVRLSGMNIIVDDDDFPLIIKVASLQEAKMQVYFLDNDDFFKRRGLFLDDKGSPFEDNTDRTVFFCKGVLETVRKFGWAPDIIHCHGWMTSLIPMYLRTAYANEPIFQRAKVIYSVYNETQEGTFDKEEFLVKAGMNGVPESALQAYTSEEGVALHEGAIVFSDGVVMGSEVTEEQVRLKLDSADKPVLPFNRTDDSFADYMDFYHALLAEEVEH
jgi:starch synthase